MTVGDVQIVDGVARLLIHGPQTDGVSLPYPHLCPMRYTGHCALCAWVIKMNQKRTAQLEEDACGSR